MILPTISDFELVTGDLNEIRLNVDVMTNRIGDEKNVLYGKDAASIMEHSSIRTTFLNGFSVRDTMTYTEVSSLDVPAVFSKYIRSSVINPYLPHNNKYIPFYGTSTSQLVRDSIRILFCEKPQEISGIVFTNSPVVPTTDSYSGTDFPTSVINPLLISQMESSVNDMKKQHHAFVWIDNKKWHDYYTFGKKEDEYAYKDWGWPYDWHGDSSYIYKRFDYYSYSASNPDSFGFSCDGWFVIGGSKSKQLTISYPTNHISSAILYGFVNGFTSTRSLQEDESSEIVNTKHDVPSFAFTIDSSSDGNLSIDQSKIVGAIKNAVAGSGGTLYTMGNVNPGSYYRAWYSFEVSVDLVIAFTFDNHTKWW